MGIHDCGVRRLRNLTILLIIKYLINHLTELFFQDMFWHFQVVAEGLGQVVDQDFFDFG